MIDEFVSTLVKYFSATPRFKYNDYWGYEVKILSELAKILNFTYTIENHPDGKLRNEKYISSQNAFKVYIKWQ